MPRLSDAYTRYPRTLLWLVRGGTLIERDADGQPAEIEIPSFYISKVPVTNEQLEAYDPGWLRSEASPGDGDPAVGVRYQEAVAYCAWYAEVSRKPIRLPTALEWRWASAGDGGWPDAEDLDAVAWHAGNSDGFGGRVPPLEGKRPNRAGLYGMLGGIWDWTSSDAEGAGSAKVVCGGSYRTPRADLLAGLESVRTMETAAHDLGFRVVKPLRG